MKLKLIALALLVVTTTSAFAERPVFHPNLDDNDSFGLRGCIVKKICEYELVCPEGSDQHARIHENCKMIETICVVERICPE